jgi:peptide/nickel transport system permease protein
VHVAPNILPLSFLYGSIAIGWAILTEAAVSFLGFGDPSRISWGFMLQDAFVSQALSRGSYALVRAAGLLHRARRGRRVLHRRGAEEVLFPKLRS